MTVSRALKILILGSALLISVAFFRSLTKGPAATSPVSLSPALVESAAAAASDQPIAFTHKAHIDNQMKCLDCHEFADKNAHASIPGVEQCMTCHAAIKTESPEIIKLAEYSQRGEEVPWRRVYKFESTAHVMFNHKRHVKADVACATCHGEMEKAQTAQVNVKHTMGWCVDCHRMNETKFEPHSRSLDCMTCHN